MSGPSLPREEFIDDIPYPETQNYVKRILGTAEDYRRMYGAAAGGVSDDDEIPVASPRRTGAPMWRRSPSRRSPPAPKKAAPAKPAAQAPRRRLIPTMSKLTGSRKALQFTESVIREMTRLSEQHGGVNLSQGFPGLSRRRPRSRKPPARPSTPTINQYAVTWGARPLREAIARDVHAPLRRRGRRRRTGHRLLRRDRGDDVDDAGGHRSGRRGRSSSSRSTRTTAPTRSCPARRRAT